MKKILAGFILMIGLLGSASAYSSAGAIWLLIPVSPTLNGMGEIGVCLSSDDIYAGYFNPANGIYGYRGLSFSYSGYKTSWLPGLVFDIDLYHDVMGLNLLPERFPLQITLSKYKTVLDFGEQIRIDEFGNELGTYKSSMTADAYSLAARYYDTIFRIPFDISIGATKKKVIQDLVPDEYLDEGSGTSRNIFYDAGFLFSLPLKFNINDSYLLSVTPAGGYSVSNIGNKIVFILAEMVDPTPKCARVGVSLTANLSMSNGLKLIEYRQGRAASDVLAKTSNPPLKYQSGLGDIDFVKNVLLSKGDEEVETSWGQEITVLDFYTLRLGRRLDISGGVHLLETGHGFHSAGLLHLLGYMTNIGLFNTISDYLTVSYNYSSWAESRSHVLTGTKFSSWTIALNNIDRIFKPAKPGESKYVRKDNPLSIIGGMNFSDIRIKDDDLRKEADIKMKTGFKIGIESRFGPFIAGMAFNQRGARYEIWNYLDVKDTYNYFSFYGFVSYPVMKRLRIFSGVEAGDCISRKAVLDDDSYDVPSININWDYGIRAGADVMIFKTIGLRTSYYHGMNYIFEYTDIITNCKNRSIELSLTYKL